MKINREIFEKVEVMGSYIDFILNRKHIVTIWDDGDFIFSGSPVAYIIRKTQFNEILMVREALMKGEEIE